MAGEQQLRELERDATAGKAAIRIGAVGAVRVHERGSGRRIRRHAVVVRHEDVDPGFDGGGNLGIAGRAAVDRNDELHATLAGRSHRPQ